MTTVTPRREPPFDEVDLPDNDAIFAWLLAHGWQLVRAKASSVMWQSSYTYNGDGDAMHDPVDVWFPLFNRDEPVPEKNRGPLREALAQVAERAGVTPVRLVGMMIGKGRASEVCDLIGYGGSPVADHYELMIGDTTVILDQAAHARGGKLLWFAEDEDATTARGATWRDALAVLAAALDQSADLHRKVAARCEERASQIRAWLATHS